jgi:hypothetical protein
MRQKAWQTHIGGVSDGSMPVKEPRDGDRDQMAVRILLEARSEHRSCQPSSPQTTHITPHFVRHHVNLQKCRARGAEFPAAFAAGHAPSAPVGAPLGAADSEHSQGL